jgi:8-oxo-dGTP pyrophosphatase MutT (NUDIX family)
MVKKDTCSLLLENGNKEVLMQLRDNKLSISFPNCISTFGGAIEDGETPEEAMIREVFEELEYVLKDFQPEKIVSYNGYNIHFFRKVDENLQFEDLKLHEGQKIVLVSKENIDNLPYEFAFGFKEILEEYFIKYH